jgi:hypothetical protein
MVIVDLHASLPSAVKFGARQGRAKVSLRVSKVLLREGPGVHSDVPLR